MMPHGRDAGRVALVTGSSRGLGTVIAQRLAGTDSPSRSTADGDDRRASWRRSATTGGMAEVRALTSPTSGRSPSWSPRCTGARPGRRARAQRHRPAAGGPWPRWAGRITSPSSSSSSRARCCSGGRSCRACGPAVRPHRQHRLGGRRPAAAGRSAYATAKSAQIGLTRELGPRARPVRHHREHGRARLHPGRTPRGRPRRGRGRPTSRRCPPAGSARQTTSPTP